MPEKSNVRLIKLLKNVQITEVEKQEFLYFFYVLASGIKIETKLIMRYCRKNLNTI
jgi:hypothetical protein